MAEIVGSRASFLRLAQPSGNRDSGALPLLPAKQLSAPAEDLGTSEPVRIGEAARRAGLYILGKSGTGKTSLIVRLIEQDIASGHGVFFLDPHGDGIEDLLSRHGLSGRLDSALLFDPEDEEHSFGINPLACRDIASLSERTKTYDRAKSIFEKLCENMFEDRPWLQLIIQYSMHVLIENQGYTLDDLPLFTRALPSESIWLTTSNTTMTQGISGRSSLPRLNGIRTYRLMRQRHGR